MQRVLAILHSHQGLASRHELLVGGAHPDSIDVAAWYGRQVIRVRKGWYALRSERRDVIRAWRVGGRLTCVSASAFHEGLEPGPVLHIEVPRGAVRLRDPVDRRRRLAPDAAVVLHWTRHPAPGDRRAVNAAHAEAVAAVCGVHSGPVRARARG